MDFHAFTYDAAVYGGRVTNFSFRGGETTFNYDYDEAGVHVQGTFTGQPTDDGARVVGTWEERSNAPLNGRTNWQGTADLCPHEGQRRLLFGTWTTADGMTGRWTIDMATR